MATFEQVTIRHLKELADQFKKNVDGYVEEVSQSILKVWESSPKDHSEALRFLKQPMPIVGGMPVAEGAKPAFDSEAAVKKLEDKVKKIKTQGKKQSNQIRQQGQDLKALKDHAEEQALKNALALKVCSGHLKKVGTLVKDLAQPQGNKFGAATSQIQPQIAKGESDVTQKQEAEGEADEGARCQTMDAKAGAEGEADEGAKCQTKDAKAGSPQALALPPKSARLIQTFHVGRVYNALYLEGGLILLVINGVGLIVYDDKGNQLMHYKESSPEDVAVLQGHEVAFFKSVIQQGGSHKTAMVILSVTKDYIQEKAVYDLGDRHYSGVATLSCKTLAGWYSNAKFIDVLDHTGNILKRIDLDCSPRSVCKSPDGNLLITDPTKIYKYDRQTGSQLLSLQVRNVLQPGAIFSLPCGSTLVMDRSRGRLCLLGQDSLWKADIWTVPTNVEVSWHKLFAMGNFCLFSNWNKVYVLKLDQ